MNNYATILRWLGNFLLVIGYVILLYNDIKVGLAVKFIGGLLCIPSFIKLKLWDALVIVGFFAIIEGSKLIHLYFQVSK